MRLHQLIGPLAVKGKDIENITVNDIQFQSGSVKNGDIYVAIKGTKHDGHDYIEEAISLGAIAVVGEDKSLSLPVPYFAVPDAREALGKMAAIFYNNRSSDHITIGITGTNGKTTTSYMVRNLLESSNRSCSLIGTVTNYINGVPHISTATTPNAVELQKMLSTIEDDYIVMEVSSHGLHQKRVEGVKFNYGIFTNLSHDHLDYHKDFDSYFETKYELFKKLKAGGEAIVNSSCLWGKKLIKKLKAEGTSIYTFGEEANDDLQLISVDSATNFIRVRYLKEVWQFNLSMPGIYNVKNAMAAILAALRIGLDKNEIQKAFGTFKGVPGRFEIYQNPLDISLIVDYAHTPDGLDNFLSTLYNSKQNKIFHVFGFRGDGDSLKRAPMLQISTQYCDEVILTFDDLKGVPINKMEEELNHLAFRWGRRKTRIIPDRTRAIEFALENALSGDLIAITGKGPEPYKDQYVLPVGSDSETIHYLFERLINANHQRDS